jgi:hypothetical protein
MATPEKGDRAGILASMVSPLREVAESVRKCPPADRPLRMQPAAQLEALWLLACDQAEGELGAHVLHEQWLRGAMAVHVEAGLARLWEVAGASIPDWLPMRHIEWLGLAYEVAARFRASRGGQSNLYLVLLDYRDSRPEPWGVYVGMTRLPPAARFDQHKAGIRAAGSVLKRGVELLIGPVLHLQHIPRAEAAEFEERLAEALRAEGLFVQGGH